MWIKPCQHGTSAQVPYPPHPQAHGRRLQVRPQHKLASTSLDTPGTGTLATRGNTAPERLSLGRTCTAL